MSVAAVTAPTAAAMVAAANSAADFGIPSMGGTVADVQEALGLTPETEEAPADETSAKTDAAIAADLKAQPGKDKKPADTKTAEKPEAEAEAKAKGDKETTNEPAEDPYIAKIKEINDRTRARHKARREREQAAQRAAQPAPTAAAPPPATQAAPAAAEKPKTDAAPAKPTPAATSEDHVKAVLSLIEKMAMGDEAVAAGEAAPKPDEARTVALGAIQEKLQELVSGVSEAKEGKALLEQQKTQIDQLKTALEGIQAAQQVREHIEAKIEPMLDQLPNLAQRRDATKLLHQKFGEFYDKYKQLPNVPELARRIERALAADAAAESPSTETPEKPAKPSKKTVSQDLSSPPAARTGPDKRSAAQALADFHARFGIDT